LWREDRGTDVAMAAVKARVGTKMKGRQTGTRTRRRQGLEDIARHAILHILGPRVFSL
jgi:hypothetical protein